MQRVAVVGNSGAGKTWLARRLAGTLHVPHVELDAVHHGPAWTEKPADVMERELDALCPADGAWVLDGNYERKGGAMVRERADTIVWLDLPRAAVMRQLLLRTVRRLITHAQLWNGNRESLRDVLSRDPERSILRWSWISYEPQRRRYLNQIDDRWIHLRSREQVTRFLRELGPSRSGPP